LSSLHGLVVVVVVLYRCLPQGAILGNTILCAAGILSVETKAVGPDGVVIAVMKGCKLGARKACNLPGAKVDVPVLQQKCTNDLVHFGAPQGVDFVVVVELKAVAMRRWSVTLFVLAGEMPMTSSTLRTK